MMHTPARSSSNIGGFARVAAEELISMQLFVALLEQERAALSAGKADTLPGLAAEKATLLEMLSRCAEQRARMLSMAGVPATAAGMQQLLGSNPDARQTWNNLLEVARRASELNAGNGFLVNQRIAHVERAIDAISGPHTSLYSTSGITRYVSGASRTLAQG